MAKVKDSWSQPDGLPGLIGRKHVDQSIFTDGTVIPREFYEDFVKANDGYYLQRGDKREITLLIEDGEYKARVESRVEGPEQWRIMYNSSSDLKTLLKARLHVSFNYLEEYRTLMASPDRQRLTVITDPAHAEYLAFYSTGTPFRYRVEIITAADRVWAELQSIIGDGREVKTLSQGAPNQVTITEDAIHVTARKQDPLPKEWFYSAWQTLISQKYLTETTMNAPEKYRSTAVLTILSLLPYVHYITAPRATLFLMTFHYTQEQLKDLLETGDQGSVIWCGKPSNPRTVFFLVDRDVEPDGAVLFQGLTGETLRPEAVEVLKRNAERPYPLYGFRSEFGRFVYIGQFRVSLFFLDEYPAFRLMAAEEQEREGHRTWIFQANPEKFDVEAAVAALPELLWTVSRHGKEIKPGDTVYLWESGKNAGIIAQAEVLTEPGPMTVAEAEVPYYLEAAEFDAETPRVRLRIARVFVRRITRRELLGHEILKDLTIIRAPFNTNYAVTEQQAKALLTLLHPEEPAVRYFRISLGYEQALPPDMEALGRVFGNAVIDDMVDQASDLSIRWQFAPSFMVVATHGENEVVAVSRPQAGPEVNPDRPKNGQTVALNWDLSVARRFPRMRHWAGCKVNELTRTEFEQLVRSDAPRLSPGEVARYFSEALKQSHIQFGSRHAEVVRSFVASLATKRMAILTGLSGSGKTQIALRFGQWFGRDRYLIVPVRPDWTGPEALLGYEDALQKGPDDRPCWQVPEALAFMLKAAVDPYNPYLLVLDEMNLAHVERYFADVLSGMESGEPVLPNLACDQKGKWQIPNGAALAIPFPDNLFVVGTVNVDETTYMFSPKVLDRANTFEFRVETEDLSADLRTPASCPEGPVALTRGFLAIASDPEWHLTQAPPLDPAFVAHLKRVHSLLSEGGFEFGHRVFREATRFASILISAGQDTLLDALDLQIFQKVLPRLHGTRKRLEPTLCALGQFCHVLDYEKDSVMDGSAPSRFNPLDKTLGAAALPRSSEKIRRMTRSLRANQFTSFTEQ